MKLRYLQDGNPPRSPGIYDVTTGKPKIVAFWPAWVGATQERVDNICRLIEAGRQFTDREEIADELAAAALV